VQGLLSVVLNLPWALMCTLVFRKHFIEEPSSSVQLRQVKGVSTLPLLVFGTEFTSPRNEREISHFNAPMNPDSKSTLSQP
jgi:hypothetical protein